MGRRLRELVSSARSPTAGDAPERRDEKQKRREVTRKTRKKCEMEMIE